MGKLRYAFFCFTFIFCVNSFARDSGTDCESHLTSAATAAHAFQEYFAGVGKKLLERGEILRKIEVALLAKEHLLLMGPPGNAKSMISDTVLGNIRDDENNPSYYRIQMTPETTMSETHGPISPKEVFESGRIKRHYDQGMLFSRNVFIDEIFDARANAQRNILGLLAERQHAQGTEIVEGSIETVIGATNRYLDEVYEKAGDQGPKALLDRFSFNVYVPGEFEMAESYNQLISSAGKVGEELPSLTFKQLDSLRALTAKVEVPQAVTEFLSLLSYRLKTQTEAMEQAALKVYRKKVQNGENPPPPYRATKYHSPRTLFKAAKILRAVVVQDWIHSGGKRPLTATIEDLKQLKGFFSLSGPDEAFTQALLDRTVNPYERSQLSAILQESQLYDETFVEIAQEMNEVVYKYALVELDGEISAVSGEEEKKAIITRISEAYLNIKTEESAAHQAARTGKDIGQAVVSEFLEIKLRDLLGADFDSAITSKAQEIENRKRQQAQQARERAEREAAELKRKEIETRKAAEAAARKERIDAYLAKQFMTAMSTPAEHLRPIAELESPEPVGEVSPGYYAHNPNHVRVKDQVLVFIPGEKGLRMRNDGSTETIDYAKDIPDAMFRALLTGAGAKTLLAMDDSRFLVKRGNLLAFVNAETLKVEHFQMLDNDGTLVLSPSRKFALNVNIAKNIVERIDLATGAVQKINANISGIAAQVGPTDFITMADDNVLTMTHQSGRYAWNLNLTALTVNNTATNAQSWQFTGSVEIPGKNTWVGVLQHSTQVYHIDLNLEEIKADRPSSGNAEPIESGANTVFSDVSVSPNGNYLAIVRGSEVSILDRAAKSTLTFHSPSGDLTMIQAFVWLDSTRIMIKGVSRTGKVVYQIFELKKPGREELDRIAAGE